MPEERLRRGGAVPILAGLAKASQRGTFRVTLDLELNRPLPLLRYYGVRRILSLSLVFLLLLGSVGLPVSRHFCGGELKALAVFGEAEGCSHAEAAPTAAPACPLHAKADTKKDCCSNEHELLAADDERQLVDAPTLPQQPIALVPFPSSFLSPWPGFHLRPRQNKQVEYYRPPPLVRDVAREFQVLRI